MDYLILGAEVDDVNAEVACQGVGNPCVVDGGCANCPTLSSCPRQCVHMPGCPNVTVPDPGR